MSLFRDYDKESEDAFISFYNDLIDNGLDNTRTSSYNKSSKSTFPDDYYDELQDFIKVSNKQEWYMDNEASTVNRIYRTDKNGNRYFVKCTKTDLQDAISNICEVFEKELELEKISYDEFLELENKSFSILFTDDDNHKEFIDWYIEQVEVPDKYWERD